MWFADIIVDISIDKLDKTFQYILPDELLGSVEIGSQVNVPFGNRRITGYVVNITDEAEFDTDRMKKVESMVTNAVTIDGRMIKLAYWMKHNYGATINQALKTVLPVKETVKEKKESIIALSPEYVQDKDKLESLIAECEKKHYTAKKRLVTALAEDGDLDEGIIRSKLNIAGPTITALVKQGVIIRSDNMVYRNPIHKEYAPAAKCVLNPEQSYVADSIIEDYDKGIHGTYLIKGVTGSGKTEVYLEVIEHVLSMDKQVIMLIPEIALTYQTVMRFYKRFGNVVSILNSRMSNGERYDQYLRAKRGELKIMIGPRSALFTPFDRLGLIVIDEEHEGAYKSDSVPRYHARETAVELAAMCNASVILGSATPSVDAYYKARSGEYKLFVMNNRAGESTLPEVETVDLREELRSGNKSIFSRRLKKMIEERLNNKEQVMLFLNRRGYVGFINCRECGHVIKCPHCDISLTAHNNGRLVCHYCGYTEPDKKLCPKCGSKYIGGFKVGTEKIEQAVKEAFPAARVLRMDFDTTKGKEGHEKILEEFSGGNADILVGTQMIVKGHDFPNVTLMGILLADLSLYSSDFRAQERTFELLTQAAGRAGRGDKRGNVIIQTYDPSHYSIQTAMKHDYDAFYEQEIMYRELMDYPPVSNLLTVKVSSKNEQLANDTPVWLLQETTKELRKIYYDEGDMPRAIGPSRASVYKLNDIFSVLLFFKHKQYTVLTQVKDILEKYIREHEQDFRMVSVQFDFNQ